MRLLVTGSSGLLGSNLSLEAVKQGHEVYGVDRNPLNTEIFNQHRADLLDPGAVAEAFAQIKPDWVVHCAALANLEACEADPDLAHQMNADMAGTVAAEAAKAGARMVHISTDAVFDGIRGGYVETDAPNPLGVYARTKLAGEHAVAAAHPEAIIARVNFYGWSPTGDRSLAEFFFNNISAGKKVNGFTDRYFCPMLVNDLVQILMQMLEAGLQGIYHTVSAEPLSKYAFGLVIARRFGLDETLIQPIEYTPSDQNAARSPNLTMNTGKLVGALGEAPPTVISGIQRLYDLYKEDYPQKLRAMLKN